MHLLVGGAWFVTSCGRTFDGICLGTERAFSVCVLGLMSADTLVDAFLMRLNLSWSNIWGLAESMCRDCLACVFWGSYMTRGWWISGAGADGRLRLLDVGAGGKVIAKSETAHTEKTGAVRSDPSPFCFWLCVTHSDKEIMPPNSVSVPSVSVWLTFDGTVGIRSHVVVGQGLKGRCWLRGAAIAS